MATEEAVMAVIRASRPSFRNPHDKIAFALHATFLASGYTLKATGTRALAETSLSSSPSDEVGIDGWNEGDDGYGFVYTKENNGSNNTVLVKCLIMGDQLLIDALGSKDQNKEPASLQLDVREYDGGNESKNYGDQYKNFKKFVETLNSKIVKQMEDSPAPQKSSSSTPSRSETREPSRQNLYENRGHEPSLVYPVDPPVGPGSYDDAIPGPGAGMYTRVGPDMGGPMLVGPNDPRWFRPDGVQPGFPGGPLGVPPGARFDPYGPPGIPGFEPNRFARNPRRPGSHPDLEPFRDSDFI